MWSYECCRGAGGLFCLDGKFTFVKKVQNLRWITINIGQWEIMPVLLDRWAMMSYSVIELHLPLPKIKLQFSQMAEVEDFGVSEEMRFEISCQALPVVRSILKNFLYSKVFSLFCCAMLVEIGKSAFLTSARIISKQFWNVSISFTLFGSPTISKDLTKAHFQIQQKIVFSGCIVLIMAVFLQLRPWLMAAQKWLQMSLRFFYWCSK